MARSNLNMDYDLIRQAAEEGIVEHPCPACGEKCNPVEPDAERAYCENCQEWFNVDPIV